VVIVNRERFILYLLFFFAGFLLILPKKPILHIALPISTQKTETQALRVFLLNPQTLEANKARIQVKDPSIMPAYYNLINQAKKLLTTKPVSVMDKIQIPPSGDKHDYMSLATYAWPNPKTPNGLPYVTHDGKINPKIYTVPDLQNLHTMINGVNILSLAYYFSNDKRYANQAALYIKTWFINPSTKMNPNLNFAQIIKGTDKGMAGGIIDTNNIPQIIDGIGILEGTDVFSSTDKTALEQWFCQYLNWMQTSPSGKIIASASNNQRTWYDDQIISIELFLNNIDQAKQLALTDEKKLLPEEINQEGGQPNELDRTKSWDYSAFNLLALCDLADLSKNVNINLWNYQTVDNRSINKAVYFLFPYATDRKKWIYKQIDPWNDHLIATPLLHAASSLNNLQYWNLGMHIQGKSETYDINMLTYQTPTKK
jgi:hypothetical protein